MTDWPICPRCDGKGFIVARTELLECKAGCGLCDETGRLIPSDSGSGPSGLRPGSEANGAQGEAPQSGGEAASPNPYTLKLPNDYKH